MTTLIDQVSSRIGDRSEAGNLKVVEQCLAEPHRVAEIVEGLRDKDAAVVGDCAEVLTKIAETHSDMVAPYVSALATLLTHKKTRVRWEAMHALAYIAETASNDIAPLLPQLQRILQEDGSIIVRDYAVDTLGNYAKVSKRAAREAYPLLREALTAWDSRHAGHALTGLAHVAASVPELREEICDCGQRYSSDKRAVVRQAAKKLLKLVE
ncbi:MAG: hypothetical protein JXA21_28325 [Anaerolineae bacterium]|nr:hypothetical protein [Anaerolineae bacterium]